MSRTVRSRFWASSMIDEAVGQAAAADVGERQHLEQATVEDLVDDLLAGDGLEGVGHGRAPRQHLLGLGPRQVAEVLAADRVDRAEHEHPVVRALLEHGVEPGRERQHALARTGRPAQAHDADLVVGQHVDGDALLGRPPADVEQRAVAAGEVHRLVLVDPPERRLAAGVQHDARVARQVAGLAEVDDVVLEQRVDGRAVDVDLHHPGPVAVARQLVAVLVRVEPHDRRLEPERQVLGDDGDVAPLGRDVAGHGQDAVVVGLAEQRRGEPGHLGVVDLDPQRAALLVRRHRPEQRAVRQAQVLEHPQGLAGGPAEVGVVTLALELGEDDQRDDHLVLREAPERSWIGEQNRRVEYVDARVKGGIVQRNPHSCRDGHRSPVKREGPRRWWMRVAAHRSPTPRGGRWDRGRPA